MKPWAGTAEERSKAESEVALLLGHRIEGVNYLLPATSGTESRRHFEAFDEVDTGVELVVPDGAAFHLRWCMRGIQEGLAVVKVDLIGADDASFKRLDVSGVDEWRRLLGRPITGVAVAWHRPYDEALDAIWAVRIVFGGSSAVVIALGEAGDAGQAIWYMPDSVVVIFDPATAKAHEPLSSLGSAWGGLIASV